MAFRHLHLTRKDMAMLSRVLANAGFNSSPDAAEAARFLTRKLQEGVKDEAELASALKRAAMQAKWTCLGRA